MILIEAQKVIKIKSVKYYNHYLWITWIKDNIKIFLKKIDCDVHFSSQNYLSFLIVICGLYHVEVCFLCAHILESFIINGCWILSKAFFVSIEIIIWLLFFNLLISVYYIDWFVDIEESLHPWDKAHLVMMYDLLICCWILFAIILLRIFTSMFISDISL